MSGYTRNDTSNNIANDKVINAADLDGEFNAVESAFNSSTGHTHDGSTAEGAPITKIGPIQDVVATATTLEPKTNDTINLGTPTKKFKNINLSGNIVVTGTVDGRDVAVDGSKLDGINQGVATTDSPSFAGLTATTADINGGNIDGTTIGATTPAPVNGTTGSFSEITGTAVTQSIEDDNIGRLLKVGDNGLAQPSVSADADLNTLAGRTRFFSWGSSSGGSPSNGPSANGHAGLQISSSSSRQIQLAGTVQGGTNPKLYYRSQDTDWSPWVELFHKSNIVGTVSQSGGNPTGAALQRGGNANGSFFRSADGLQICQLYNIKITNPYVWTFPIAFAAVPVALGMARQSSLARMVTVSQETNSKAEYYMWSDTGASSTVNANLFAIGRWF